MENEVLDIVDKDDLVIGTIDRKDYLRLIDDSLGYIRASELFIMNGEGKLWIPIRTASKIIAPNGYDYSAAGHVESGDSYLNTIIRETMEEINLEISEGEIELVTKMRSDDVKYFRSIYLLRSEVTPNFNPNDFVSAEWLTPVELIQSIDAGHPAKSSLKDTVMALQEYLIKG